MSKVSKVSLGLGAILAWAAFARSASALAQAVVHLHWLAAAILLVATIAFISVAIWLSEFIVGAALDHYRTQLLAMSARPALAGQAKARLNPATLKSANDYVPPMEWRQAHNDHG